MKKGEREKGEKREKGKERRKESGRNKRSERGSLYGMKTEQGWLTAVVAIYI